MRNTSSRAALIGVLLATVALICSCTSSTAGHPEAAAPPGDRPNIVFVLTDDLSRNLVAHMPHVQAMQQNGMTMSNYFVVDSLCCPSRSAIFTGQYAHDNGVFTNTPPDGGYDAFNRNGDQQKSFAVALQKAGYRTAMMGKYLNGYQPQNAVPPGWNEWDVAGNGYPEFNYDLNQNGTTQHYGHDAASYLTDVVAQKAGSFVDSSAAAGKPFMLEVATFAPHAPYTPAPRDAHSARGLKYPKTPAWNTLPSNPPSWLKDRAPLNPKEKKKIIRVYRKRVEAVQAVDDMIGHLQDELKAKGLDKNTYFVFSSDNGYHMGEYRLAPGKQTAFDTDIHVPLVVTGPGVPAGSTSDQMTSNIDLCPTFESLGGATVPADADGQSLAGLWHGEHPSNWPRAVLVEHHGPDRAKNDPDRQSFRAANPPSYQAVRTAEALYVQYKSGEQEYYDLRHDPFELHNLAAGGVPPDLPKKLAAMTNCHSSAACRAAADS
ncbi:MAG TPA: sulfatase [Mycobacteriales bacterium]|nr:sulfatase [Mycobacteriales bacterium]